MKIKYFFLTLDVDDFKSISDTIVSDFNFQTYFFSNYIQKNIKNKFESNDFNFVGVQGSLYPKKKYEIDKVFKNFSIEVPFNMDKYQEIYPYKNNYPLNDNLLKPIKDISKFNHFLYEMFITGMDKIKQQDAPISVDEFYKILNEFKEIGFKNEWIFKKKTFKEHSIKGELKCELTCNFFNLKLSIWKNNNKIFDKEIIKTLPMGVFYETEFNDILIEGDILKISKKLSGYLFEIPLSELNL